MTAQKRMDALRMVEERTRGLSGGSNCGSTKSRRGRWTRGRACPTADLHYFAPWPTFQTSMRRREHLIGKGATQNERILRLLLHAVLTTAQNVVSPQT